MIQNWPLMISHLIFKPTKLQKRLRRDEIESSSDEEEVQETKKFKSNDGESSDEEETAHEKAERLAKSYVEQLKQQRKSIVIDSFFNDKFCLNMVTCDNFMT